MAFTPNTFSELYGGPIEGGFKTWVYTTTDLITTVVAAGYFTVASPVSNSAGFFGVSAGDMIWVINQTSPTTAPATQVQVTAVATSTTAGFVQPTGAITVQQTGLTTLGLSNNPRNMVDGGDFTTNPWQGGTSFNATTSTVLTADRWNIINGAGQTSAVSRASHTDVQGFNQALRWGRSSTVTAVTGVTLGQVMETADSIRAQGLPISLSFWAQAGSSFAAGATGGAFSAIVVSGTGTDQSFSSLASGNWTGTTNVISQAVVPTTSSVRYGPFTGIVPTNSTQIGLVFSYTPGTGTTAGTTETIDFQGVQMEAGGMTSFEHLDVAEVVSIAQRYRVVFTEGTTGVQTGFGTAFSGTVSYLNVPLPTTMRTAPTVTLSTASSSFGISDAGAAGVALTGWGSAAAAHTTQNIGIISTVASGLTLGHAVNLVGRTTGSGTITCSADY